MMTLSQNQKDASTSFPKSQTVSKKAKEREEILTQTLAQLAERYNVDRRTMRRWLKKIEHIIGPRLGYLYSPQQVELIDANLGISPDR